MCVCARVHESDVSSGSGLFISVLLRRIKAQIKQKTIVHITKNKNECSCENNYFVTESTILKITLFFALHFDSQTSLVSLSLNQSHKHGVRTREVTRQMENKATAAPQSLKRLPLWM